MKDTAPRERAATRRMERAAIGTLASFAVLLLSTVQAQPESDLVLRVTTTGSGAVDSLVRDDGTIDLPTGTNSVRVEVAAGAGEARVFDFALDGEVVATIDASAHAALDVPIGSGEDDAEEFANASRRNPTTWPAGFTFTTSSDLELGHDPTHGDQLVALRFENLGVPHGARILRAEVVFAAEGTSDTGNPSLTITGELSSAADPFEQDPDGAGSGRLSRRPRTETAVLWTIDEPWRAGERFATPELGPIVQEVVDHDGWDVDSALVLFFDADVRSDAHRRATSFEGAGGDPGLVTRLVLAYESVPENGYSVDIDVTQGASNLTVTSYARQEARDMPIGTVRVTLVAASAQTPAPVLEPPSEHDAPGTVGEPPLPIPSPGGSTASGSTAVADVIRLPVRALGSTIVLGDVVLTSFDDATSSLTSHWRRQRITALAAGVYVGSCAAPGELLLELRPLDPEEEGSETRVPVAGSALRYGGFAVIFRDTTGAAVGCVNLAD